MTFVSHDECSNAKEAHMKAALALRSNVPVKWTAVASQHVDRNAGNSLPNGELRPEIAVKLE